jgi:hypothetical protein
MGAALCGNVQQHGMSATAEVQMHVLFGAINDPCDWAHDTCALTAQLLAKVWLEYAAHTERWELTSSQIGVLVAEVMSLDRVMQPGRRVRKRA